MEDLHISFFTEAGTSRGIGHLIRCFTISQKFKSLGIKTSFYLDSDIDFGDKFSDIIYFKWTDFELNKNYDVIFIDSYEANINVYKTISNSCKVAVYVDDFKRLNYPKGVILNFAPDAKEMFFKQPEERHQYLLGLKYIPIREEFLNLKKIDKKEQIFIMLGGSDTANLSLELAEIFKNIMIQKVIVSNNKDTVNSLQKYKNIKILYKPSDKKLIQAMADSTIAISTASMSVYELAYLKVPTLIIAVAKNQEMGISQLIKHNIVSDVVSIKHHVWKDNIAKKTKQILAENSHDINNVIDGTGTEKIVSKILELIE